jgi:O-antigen/teichoic acid export membrane protein
MPAESRTVQRIAVHAGGTLVGSLAQLTLIALIARHCAPERWALVMEILASVAIFEMASDFGGRFWFGERFARGYDPRALLRLALAHKAVWTTGMACVALAAMPSEIPRHIVLLSAAIGCSQPMSDPLLWMLRATGRTDREAAVALVSRLAAILGFGALVLSGAPLWMACMAWLATNLFRFGLLRASESRHVPCVPGIQPAAAVPRLRSSIVESIPLGGAMVLQSIQYRLGTFLVGDGCDPRIVGEYASAFSLVAASSFVGTSIGATMFGALVDGAERARSGAMDPSIARLLGRMRLVLVLVSSIGMIASPAILTVVLGRRSDGALLAMLVLWTGLYFSSAQFGLRLSMSARGRAGWDVFAVVVGIGVIMATKLVDVPCERRAALIATGWCAGELASLGIKYAVLGRGAIGTRIIALDAVSLGWLVAVASLVWKAVGAR